MAKPLFAFKIPFRVFILLESNNILGTTNNLTTTIYSKVRMLEDDSTSNSNNGWSTSTANKFSSNFYSNNFYRFNFTEMSDYLYFYYFFIKDSMDDLPTVKRPYILMGPIRIRFVITT